MSDRYTPNERQTLTAIERNLSCYASSEISAVALWLVEVARQTPEMSESRRIALARGISESEHSVVRLIGAEFVSLLENDDPLAPC